MNAAALTAQPLAARPLVRTTPGFERTTGFDFDAIRQNVSITRRVIRAGQAVYRAGQPFHAVYLVWAGLFKSVQVSDDGEEQITGFRMRGDILGVDSIGMPCHGGAEVALDDGEVWVVEYAALRNACSRVPELQEKLTSAMAGEIRRDRSWMLMLSTLCAEQRVAAFLLDLSSRSAKLGLDPERLVLRMSRAEIGSYLALTLETVTRAMSQLAARHLIDVQRRQIRIVEAAALRRLVGCSMKLH